MFDLKDNKYNNLHNVVPEAGQSRTVRMGDEWILAFRTLSDDSDVIKNIKTVLTGLDIEDVRYLNSLVLIGSTKSAKVDSNLVKDLVKDRATSTMIIRGIKDELSPDFGYKIYNRGPHRRLAIRLPIQEIKDFMDEYSARIREILLKEGNITPDTIGDILSVYLIANETYVRLEPEEFFKEIFERESEPNSKTRQSESSGMIVLGESPQELIELTLNKLKEYRVYRDIRFVEAAGFEYPFDACAAYQDEKILIKYIEKPTEDDIISMNLYLKALNADKGWILTRESDMVDEALEQWQTDGITLLTIKDL